MTLATFDGRVPIGAAPKSAEPSSSAAPMRPRIARVAHRLGASALAILLAAPPVAGQDAGAVDQAIANQNITLRRFAPQRPAGSVEATVIDQRSRTPVERAAAIRFTLRSVTVEGNDAVPRSALAPIWAGKIGTSVSLAEVYDFARAIEAAYLERDFYATAFAPVQDVTSGAIVIRVNEAYVSEIEIASQVPGIEGRLAAYVDPIVAMRPIRVSKAERVLSLLAEVGGMQIEGTLDSPEPTGGATLRLEADIARVQGGVSLDNYGNAQAGPLQLSANVAFNNLFHHFETTSLLAVTVPDSPREMRLLQGAQHFPLGTAGLWLGYNLTWLTSQPGGDSAGADIDLSTKIASAYLYYPFVRDFTQSLAGWVEINARNDDIDIAGQPVVSDRARWMQVALQYDRKVGDGALTAVASLAQGLGGLGANTGRSDFSRPDVPGDYRFGRLDLDYRRPLGEQASLRLRATGQYAVDPLPGAVQFSVGGDPYGWAFTGHGIAGDKGAAASLELAHDVAPWLNWLPGWQVRGFADYGGVWNNDPGGDFMAHDAFGSLGIGLVGGIGGAGATVTVATPWLRPENADHPGTGVFFSLAWGF